MLAARTKGPITRITHELEEHTMSVSIDMMWGHDMKYRFESKFSDFSVLYLERDGVSARVYFEHDARGLNSLLNLQDVVLDAIDAHVQINAQKFKLLKGE
jgi:hypothetical protein